MDNSEFTRVDEAAEVLSGGNSWVTPIVGSKGPHHFGFSPRGKTQSGRCDGPAVPKI